MPESYLDLLFIEYQYVRIYCNSIGMQAVCERAVTVSGNEPASLDGSRTTFDAGDQGYIQEVIGGSCDMLEKVISLADKNTLRFAPVRVFIRALTSSIFLLKAICLGIRNGQVRTAIDILHRTAQALRTSVPDDMHLVNSYAVLLELHIDRFQKSFLASVNRAIPTRHNTRQASMEAQGSNGNRQRPTTSRENNLGDDFSQVDWDSLGLNDDGSIREDDWFSLPFDPAMAPFGSTGTSTFPVGIDNDGLSFIWNRLI